MIHLACRPLQFAFKKGLCYKAGVCSKYVAMCTYAPRGMHMYAHPGKNVFGFCPVVGHSQEFCKFIMKCFSF